MKRFWDISSGRYKIDTEALYDFLNDNGFFSYCPNTVDDIILIRIKDRIVRHVSWMTIRKFCWDYINEVYVFDYIEERKQVKNVFHKSKSLFSKDNLMLLKQIDINEIQDTADTSYLFFKNCVLKVTATDIEKLSYEALEGYVWDEGIIDRNFNAEIDDNWEYQGDFYEFFKDITKHADEEVQEQNRTSLMTIIGYMLHRYKNQARAYAIVLMDTYKDGNPNGGTGKGILSKAIEQIRSTSFINGKDFTPSKGFPYSHVRFGIRVLVFDDVPKNFNFERIFPLITEKAVIERKYENKFIIPFEESPKILITTNYTVKGLGTSNMRRKIEFILSDTYNESYTPEDKLGHLLFVNWDEKQWTFFYLFILECIGEYLFSGIIEAELNIAERSLHQTATKEFIQYARECIELGIKYNKKSVYDDFVVKYPNNSQIKQYTFTKWLKLYADSKGYGFHESHSGDANFFEFTSQ